MERPKINTAFDEHDYDQLVMLAKLNRMRLAQLVRHICKAYIDGRKPELRGESDHVGAQ
jgi:hypothetical protein